MMNSDAESATEDAVVVAVADNRVGAPAPEPGLRRALSVRAPGAWIGFTPADDISPVESYRRAVRDFDREVTGLDAASWASSVPTYGTVHDLIAHLVAIESYVGGQLGVFEPQPGAAELDHVAFSKPTIDIWREQPSMAVLTEWRRRTAAVLAAADADHLVLSQAGSWHQAPVSIGDLFVIRTFELWTHTDDVRRSLGRPVGAPDNGQLRLMTNLAAAVLPLALALAHRLHAGHTARLVLTGRGGGTWRRPLDPDSAVGADDDVIVIADAIDFCRLTANRLSPAEIEVGIEGDAKLASDLLAAIQVLAVD